MNRPRRVRSPPFGYDPRVMGRAEPRPPPDFDDPYSPATPFEPPQSAPAFVEPHHPQYPISYRDLRLPSTYRATLREPYPNPTGSAAYKILCITNINQKISDGAVKEALTSEFSRFGDISVSVCHDSGERLAYIYFRTYEEAREARHAKSRSMMFDRPIEIEPIYEPRTSPVDSPPPQPVYTRRRSMTPPEYYGVNGPAPPQPPSRRQPPPPPPQPHHRAISPGPNYPSRYPPGCPPPMAYGRYYLPPSHLPHPYSSPPHDPYRSYPAHPPPQPLPQHFPPGHHSYPSPYGPSPMPRDRERPFPDGHMPRSPRHEAYYGSSMDQRGYPAPLAHSSRGPPSVHSSSSHHPHPSLSPGMHHQSSSSSSHRRSSPPPQAPSHPEQQPRYMSREYRREKYSSDVYSNEPEEGRPSRVLFITNIDPAKSETEVREVFEPFGVIEDIEVRKISPEISSALIRFSSMDCAYKAKTATNSKYLGNLKFRITYGKVSASRRLWIGGLGQATTTARLEGEFGNYGNIINLDYNSGRPYAYIEFETANQAQFATHHLRGTFAADAERKLRIEYVDPVSVMERNDKTTKPDSSHQAPDPSGRSRTNEYWTGNEIEASPKVNNRKRSGSPLEMNSKRTAQSQEVSTPEYRLNATKLLPNSPTSDNKHVPNRNELNNNQQTVNSGDSNNQAVDNELRSNQADESPNAEMLVKLRSIKEIVECCSISWLGQLVLRNFNFPSRMFMCSGRKAIVEKYITKLNVNNEESSASEDQCPILRITQRWRLHPQPKLEEVKRRMQSGNLGMLIITSRPDQSPILSSPTCKTPQSSTSQGVPPSTTAKQNGDDKGGENCGGAGSDKTPAENQGVESSVTQSRPLKNLISYLEQKDAAGVISLNALDRDHPSEGPKLMYAFPPGDFALNLLKRKAPNLNADSIKEEFLLGVIVGGADTKI